MFNWLKKKRESFDDLTPAQDVFLAGSINEYNCSVKQFNDRWHAEHSTEWQYIKENDTFELRKWGEVVVKADAQILGSFDGSKKTWEWAWSNPSIGESAKRASFAVRDYGRKENIVYFKTGIVPVIRPNQTTYFAAIGRKLTGAEAVYSGYAGTLLIYTVLKNIEEKG